MTVRILSVAESDSSGATGLQADIKTTLALGGYAMTAVSVLTAQNSAGIWQAHPTPPALLAQQMQACLDDGGADAIKIGFLPDTAAVNAVGDILDGLSAQKVPVIVDPSVVSRQGKVLVDGEAIAAWKRRLYLHAKVLTPNLKEAELLSGMSIPDMQAMINAADIMRTLGVENVVLKVRQALNNKEIYVVATGQEERVYERDTLKTRRTLGAGSTFSTAIATGIAQGMDVFTSVERALDFLHRSMSREADGAGEALAGVDHGFNVVETPFVGTESQPVRKYQA